MNLWNLEDTLSLDELQKKGIEVNDKGEQAEKLYNHIDLHYAIRKLSRRQKEAIQLRIEGFHCFEIAERLSITRKTVYNHLYRAKKRLGNIIRGVVQ